MARILCGFWGLGGVCDHVRPNGMRETPSVGLWAFSESTAIAILVIPAPLLAFLALLERMIWFRYTVINLPL
jgi:hypothetical protein